MGMTDPEYGRGWQRFGFDTLDFFSTRVHSGPVDVDVAIAFDRGIGRPMVAYVVIPPGGEAPAIATHVHRSEALGKDVEEWYVIIEGTGVQRFTNGDEVTFGPGDLIAVYPGTGHSLQVTGDQPVKMLGILPELFAPATPAPVAPPDRWEPRIEVLTTTENLNPLTARCTDCGAAWERPGDDPGSDSLPVWAGEHACTPAPSPSPWADVRVPRTGR
jgi:mannose-6-phosphate isomerase-like protein (cupin superfamily)